MTNTANAPERKAIVAVICAELEKVNDEKIDLSESTDITKDLHVDSLAVMDLIFALEEHFDVSVPLNDLADIQTIGELSELVEKIAAKEA